MSVTCQLFGRFGNQLFQVAAAMGYADKWGIDFFMPKQTLAPNSFEHYLTTLKVPKRDEIPKYYKIIREPGHAYSELPFYPNAVLNGYFQSAKYFDHIRPTILNVFSNIIPYKPISGFVGLHVRRGDYLQFADKHPTVTYDYIREAVLHFNSLGYYSFVVCSDDISWCIDQLKGLEVYGNAFSYSRNNSPYNDMSLLACCEHQIISNSTFSWWAAYLNRNPDKKVIAPKVWFGEGNKHLETKDIYTPEMILL